MAERKHLTNQNVGEIGGKSSLSYPSVGWLYFSTAAALSKTAVAPIDRVKLLLQNQGGMVRDGRLSEPYKGIGNCFRRTIIEEGFASLWRGNVANLIRYVPTQALTLKLWDSCKKANRELGFGKDEVGYYKWCHWNVRAGLAAGFDSCLLVYPMEYARTRLALDTKKRGAWQYRGLVDLCRKTWAADGFAGFYRGCVLSVVSAGAYRGIYFGMYESLKPDVLTGKMQDSFMGRFALAWASATVAGSAMYICDTLRRRLMTMSGVSMGLDMKVLDGAMESTQLLGMDKTVFRASETRGEFRVQRSLFRGVVLNIPRSVVGAAMLAAYDTASTHSITHAFTK